MIYSYLRFISYSYAFTIMVLDGRFPIDSQVGLFGIIASNSTKLAKANFGGITTHAIKDIDKQPYRNSKEIGYKFNYVHSSLRSVMSELLVCGKIGGIF
jgi:hypothetical protein